MEHYLFLVQKWLGIVYSCWKEPYSTRCTSNDCNNEDLYGTLGLNFLLVLYEWF